MAINNNDVIANNTINNDISKEEITMTNNNNINDLLAAIDSGAQLEEVSENKVVVINSQKKAAHVIAHDIMVRQEKGCYSTLLSIMGNAEDGCTVEVGIQPVPTNPFINDITLEDTWMVTSSGNTLGYFERFTRDFVMVNVDNKENVGLLFDVNKGIVHAIYRAISGDGLDSFWVRKSVKKGGKIHDFMVNVATADITTVDEWKAAVKDNGYYVYDGQWATSSPGELKKHTMRMPGRYVGPDSERGVDWEEIFRTRTSGAWDAWIKKGGSKGYKDIAEFNARVTLPNAWCRSFDERPVNVYGIYCGKMKKDTVMDGYTFADGIGFILDEYYADSLNSVQDEYKFTPESVTGMLLQERQYHVNKKTGLVVPYDTMRHVERDWGAKVYKIFLDEITEEEKAAFVAMSMSKFKKTKWTKADGTEVDWKNTLVIFYADRSFDNKAIEYFTDANGQKTGCYPWDYESGLRVLNVAHEDKGEIVLSTQVLSSYAACNWDKTVEMVNVLAQIAIDDKVEKLFSDKGKAPSWADFQNDDIDHGIVDDIAPVVGLDYLFGNWQNKVNQTLKSLSTMFTNLNIPVDGTHTTIVPDLAVVFAGIPVLGVNEDGVTEMYSTTKAASTISRDAYVSKFVKAAIAAGIKPWVRQVVIEAIDTLAPGISVVPADETTARANEGWDFDGDSEYTSLHDKNYKTVVDEDGVEHYVEDKDGDIRVITGHVNRYPKNHPYGYCKALKDSWLKKPLCVWID